MDADAVPPVDLDAIVASYAPNAAIARLLFVADRAEARDAPAEHLPPPDPAPDAALELAALRHAHDLLRKSENTSLYVAVCERIGGRLGDAYVADKDWVDAVETRAAKRKEMLESELAGYKTNAIKESIRMGHVDLGDFYRARGDAANAFKSYARTRDYCSTNRHVVSTCLNVVRVGVESGNFAHVQTYCAKAAAAASGGAGPAAAAGTTAAHTTAQPGGDRLKTATNAAAAADPCALAELARAAGLAALHARKYALAARKFSESCHLAGAGAGDGDGVHAGGDVGMTAGGTTGTTASALSASSGAPTSAPTSDLSGARDLDSAPAEILCARDVAACGALCGVASLDPAESRALFHEDAAFRHALDHALETRAFVQHFFAHRFAEALEALDAKIAPGLAFDAHLRDHADALRRKIREKALARYCAPYSRLDLTVMAGAFKLDLPVLMRELASLIATGAVEARIDAGGGGAPTLSAARAETKRRAAALAEARRAGRAYADGVARALVRASLLEHDLVVGGGFREGGRGFASAFPYGGPKRESRKPRSGDLTGFGEGLGSIPRGPRAGGDGTARAGRRVSAGGGRERAARGGARSHARGETAMDHD